MLSTPLLILILYLTNFPSIFPHPPNSAFSSFFFHASFFLFLPPLYCLFSRLFLSLLSSMSHSSSFYLLSIVSHPSLPYSYLFHASFFLLFPLRFSSFLPSFPFLHSIFIILIFLVVFSLVISYCACSG